MGDFVENQQSLIDQALRWLFAIVSPFIMLNDDSIPLKCMRYILMYALHADATSKSL